MLLATVIQLDKGDFVLLCNRTPDENIGYGVELAHSHGALFIERLKEDHVGRVLDIAQGRALSLQPLGRTFYKSHVAKMQNMLVSISLHRMAKELK